MINKMRSSVTVAGQLVYCSRPGTRRIRTSNKVGRPFNQLVKEDSDVISSSCICSVKIPTMCMPSGHQIVRLESALNRADLNLPIL